MMRLLARERPYLFSPAAVGALRLSIAGDLSVPELRHAIRVALRTQPLACTHVVLTDSGDAYLEPLDEPCCTIDSSKAAWPQALCDIERSPFDVAGGELVRFAIIPGRPVRLLICAHRLIADGAALAHLAHVIMTALAGGSPAECPHTPPASDPDAGLPPMAERMRTRMLAMRWRSGGRAFTLRDRLRLSDMYPAPPAEVALGEVRGDCLPTDDPEARDALLAAALARALGGRAPLCLAVSMRGERAGMGNYAVNLPLECAVAEGQPLSAAARDVLTALHAPQRDPAALSRRLCYLAGLAPTLIDAAYFAAYDDYGDPIARQAAQMCGYLGEPAASYLDCIWGSPLRREYGELLVSDCAYVPPLIPGACRAVGAVAHGGDVVLTLRERTGCGEGDTLARMAEALASAASTA